MTAGFRGLVSEQSVAHVNEKTPIQAAAHEGRWPPVRAATCPVTPNQTLEGEVRPLEQPQRLGLLLLRPSRDGPGRRLSLRAPRLPPGRGSGSLVGRILGAPPPTWPSPVR